MRCVFKIAVLLAALGVVVVLITPAQDELPGTAAHKNLNLSLAISSVFTVAHAEAIWKNCSFVVRGNQVVEVLFSRHCALLC